MEYNELIEKLAATLGVEGLEQEDGVAVLNVDGMHIAFLHEENKDELLIFATVGMPPPEAEDRFANILLQANHLFHATGGAAFAQNPETREYTLVRALPLGSLDGESLAAALDSFVNTLEKWIGLLADFRPSEDTAKETGGQESTFDFGNSAIMQV